MTNADIIGNLIWGYVITTVGGLIVIGLILELLYRIEKEPNNFRLVGGILGVVDRLLYLTALLGGKPELIAVWLAIKTAPTWAKRKGKNVDPISANVRWAISLIGNGLSILFAVIGYLFITSLVPASHLEFFLFK